MTAKSELRLELKSKRLALTPSQVAASSKAITARVIAGLDWRQIRSVHCYNPLTDQNEVDTGSLQDWMRRRGIYIHHPGRQVTVEEMSSQFDLIIVPVLGFDRSLHRLGYGGGFYDRLLAAQTQAIFIGLAFDLSLVPAGLPTEPHDQALDLIFTETATIKKAISSK